MNNDHKIKVFILDDESDMCRAIMKALSKYKMECENVDHQIEFSVDCAHNKKEFIKKTTDNKYDVHVIDYKLPDCNGINIVKNLKEKNEDSVSIMITAYATFETAVQATKMGAYDFLAKPFSPDELKYVLKKAVTHLIFSRRLKKIEEEKKAQKFQFVSVLSHELKSPINAIDGYLNLLVDNIVNDEEKKNEIIQRSIKRIGGMRRLINDLLDITRLESGVKKRDIKEIDISQILTRAIETHENHAEKRNIRIEADLPKKFKVYGDESEFEIIFNNMISNGVKYNKENGSLYINLKEEEKTISISFKDTGIGIAEKDIPKLFKEFSRIKNENTINILGSGLGLSTVMKVAKLYKGDIKVESNDNGTCFTVLMNKDKLRKKDK